ncbi:MAG: IPT/TIG domain-containing protein, partial [Actinomycetota bacterium]|nr:IPT/TIG domain-containing protein [Actinomycetota bacterium]
MKFQFRWGRFSRIWRNFLLAVVATVSVLSVSAQPAIVSNIANSLTSSPAGTALPYSFGSSITAPSNAAVNLGASQPYGDCISSGKCVVVNTYLGTGGQRLVYASSATGAVTAATEIPLPQDASTTSQDASVSAIRCLSSGCVVLGTYLNTTGTTELFVATGTGTTPSSLSWTSTMVNVGSASPSLFTQLGCSSLGNCIVGGGVVGTNTATHGSAYVIAEVSGTWKSVQPAPLRANAVASTYHLACATDGSICGLMQIAFGDSSANLYSEYVDTASFTPSLGWSSVVDQVTGSSLSVGYGEVSVSCTTGQCIGAYAPSGTTVDVVDFTAAKPTTTAFNAPSGLNVVGNAAANTMYCDASDNCQIALPLSGVGSGGYSYAAYYIATVVAGSTTSSFSPMPLPSGASSTNGDSLLALDCKDYQDCTYVGQYGGSAFTFDLTAGTAGSITSVALPTDAAKSTESPSKLSASCSSFDACTVTGLYLNSQNETVPFLTTIASGVAQSSPVVIPSLTSPQLSSSFTNTDCTSTGNCVFVGTYADNTANTEVEVAIESNGSLPTSGAELSLPSNALTTSQRATVTGISCTSDGNCWIVGSYATSTSSSVVYVAQVTNGVLQSASALPLPSSALSSTLSYATTINCPNSTSCVIFGASGGQYLLDTLTGTTWSAAAFPIEVGRSLGGIFSASCPTTTYCVAYGSSSGSSGPSYKYVASLVSITGGATSETISVPSDIENGNTNFIPGFVRGGSITCSTATNCEVLTQYEDNSPGYSSSVTPLTISSPDTANQTISQSTPVEGLSLFGPRPGLNGASNIACSTNGNCYYLVSDLNPNPYNYQVDIVSYNLNKGSLAVTPLSQIPLGNDSFGSMTCAGDGSCSASVSVSGTSYILNEIAGAWFADSTSNTVGTSASPVSLSCTAAESCTGVVSYTQSGSQSTISTPFTLNASLPIVGSVSPNNGAATGGNTITINGYDIEQGANVTIGGIAATNLSYNSSTSLTAVVPSGTTGSVDVVVSDSTGSSILSQFDQYTYDAAPTVSAISPNQGPLVGGTSVTIKGTGFTSGSTVDFGST